MSAKPPAGEPRIIHPMRGIFSDRWACVLSGHAVAAPPRTVMNSRRRIGPPGGVGPAYARNLALIEHQLGVIRSYVRVGQKRKWPGFSGMSGLPPTADMPPQKGKAARRRLSISNLMIVSSCHQV